MNSGHKACGLFLGCVITAMGICDWGWCAIPAEHISDFSGAWEVCAVEPLNGGLWVAVVSHDSRGQIWFSDGTADGTASVKEITPSRVAWYNFANPRYNVGDKVFFVVRYDYMVGEELWVSDGSEDNTRLLLTTSPGPYTWPEFLNDMGSIVYFRATTDGYIYRLWRSDGTVEGTYPLNDALVMSDWRSIVVGNVLYYLADDGLNGTELWRTDGTDAGTCMVKDVNPGVGDGVTAIPVVCGGALYFAGRDGERGLELYRSDGTEAGTEIVKDIALGTGDSSPVGLTALGDILFFFADDGIHGNEPWITNGTGEGTSLVKDICAGETGSAAKEAMVLGDKAYFVADDGLHAAELWKSDGTEAGTGMVLDFDPAPSGINVWMALEGVVAGHVYFHRSLWPADDDGSDFYRTDGTEAGTSYIARVVMGPSPPVQGITSYNGTVYFGSRDVLFRLDGTTAEMVAMEDTQLGVTSNGAFVYPRPVLLGDRLYLNGAHGLWAIDAGGPPAPDDDEPSGPCCFGTTAEQRTDWRGFAPPALLILCLHWFARCSSGNKESD